MSSVSVQLSHVRNFFFSGIHPKVIVSDLGYPGASFLSARLPDLRAFQTYTYQLSSPGKPDTIT